MGLHHFSVSPQSSSLSFIPAPLLVPRSLPRRLPKCKSLSQRQLPGETNWWQIQRSTTWDKTCKVLYELYSVIRIQSQKLFGAEAIREYRHFEPGFWDGQDLENYTIRLREVEVWQINWRKNGSDTSVEKQTQSKWSGWAGIWGFCWAEPGNKTRMNGQGRTWPQRVSKTGVRVVALIYKVIGPHLGNLSQRVKKSKLSFGMKYKEVVTPISKS